MKTLTDLKKKKGDRALVRVDYNVPLKGNTILDTRRIDASFETIRILQKKGYQVSLIAHLGDGEMSLKPIATYLAKHFQIHFETRSLPELFSKKNTLTDSPNTVTLFENIRRYKEEEKNTASFAKGLASLADIYVNDAFSVSHRKHASVVGISKYLPAYMGVQLQKEIKELSKLFNAKKHPFLFILGGAKFETKIPLIERFIDTADQLVISGAILNSFYKVAGFEVGASVFDSGFDKKIKKILSSPKILLPTDVVVVRGNKRVECHIDEVEKKDKIVDIGSESTLLIAQKIAKAKVIVWNGPTGWYEGGFVGATVALAQAIKKSKAFSVIGGGDTGAVVEKVVGNTKNLFVSTGGGATLEYLAKGTLPGIECLKK